MFPLDLSLFSTILTSAVATVVLLYVFVTWHYDYWKKRGVAHVQPVPFFGTFKEHILMRQSQGQVTRDHCLQFPKQKYVGGFSIRHPFIVVRDLDLVKTVLVKEFESFHDRSDFPVDERRMPLSPNLLTLCGWKWKAIRSKVTPAFTTGKIRQMYQFIEECCEELSEVLEDTASREEDIDMKEIMSQFTMDIIAACTLGIKTNALKDPDNEFRHIGQLIFNQSLTNFFRIFTLTFMPWLAIRLGISFEGAQASTFFMRLTKTVEEQRKKTSEKRNDFIDLLLQLKRNEKLPEDKNEDLQDPLLKNAVTTNHEIQLTDELLAAQVFIIFAGGFETTSTVTSYMLYELALHQHMQDQLFQEIDKTIADNNGKLSYAAIQSMTYLDKVWCETLRKYPPPNNLVRTVTKPFTLPDSNVVLPKGMKVYIPLWAIHHDPEIYPNPQQFDPERFSNESKAKRHHYAFLPFGEGPHMCIGIRFGILQGKMGVATLLSKYRFSPCSRTQIPIRFDPKSFVMSSIDGIWLTVKKR